MRPATTGDTETADQSGYEQRFSPKLKLGDGHEAARPNSTLSGTEMATMSVSRIAAGMPERLPINLPAFASACAKTFTSGRERRQNART